MNKLFTDHTVSMAIQRIGTNMGDPDSTEPSDEFDFVADRKRQREAIFLSLCPPLYRETEYKKIPDQQALKLALAWSPVLDKQMNKRGLIMVGEPGSGKTRAAWLVIHKAVMLNARVICFDGVGFGLSVSKHLGDPDTAEEWISTLCKTGLLFIDDLFKAKMTEGQEFAVFGILDRRAAWKLPTIVTMNSSGASLASRSSAAAGERDRMEAIMRRLSEFADVIRFQKPKGATA
jgi:DNA replication protein DnaC